MRNNMSRVVRNCKRERHHHLNFRRFIEVEPVAARGAKRFTRVFIAVSRNHTAEVA